MSLSCDNKCVLHRKAQCHLTRQYTAEWSG